MAAASKKKKHTLKKAEPLPHIEGDFDLLACDLSMYCPGFAHLSYNAETRSVSIVKKSIVPNRSGTAKKKGHGWILNEIGSVISNYMSNPAIKVSVRERAFSRYNAETQALNKVVGVSDMISWHMLNMEFQELTAATVKRNVTGFGRAEKEEVAEAIGNYCEHSTFNSDDESDAVAVGIAWLIENGYMCSIPLEKYETKVLSDDESSPDE